MRVCENCGNEILDNQASCEHCNASDPAFTQASQDIASTPQKKSMALSYISAAVYPLILAGLSILIYLYQETSMAGMIIGLILSVATGIVIGSGGFYLIIIPLPVIFLFKWGCLKPYQPLWRKIILGILSFVLPVLVFVALFVAHEVA